MKNEELVVPKASLREKFIKFVKFIKFIKFIKLKVNCELKIICLLRQIYAKGIPLGQFNIYAEGIPFPKGLLWSGTIYTEGIPLGQFAINML